MIKEFTIRNLNKFFMSEKFISSMPNDLLEDINNKKVKISNFGTFEIRHKKQREGRNPKTKEIKTISARNVVLFKPSKDFKRFINLNES